MHTQEWHAPSRSTRWRRRGHWQACARGTKAACGPGSRRREQATSTGRRRASTRQAAPMTPKMARRSTHLATCTHWAPPHAHFERAVGRAIAHLLRENQPRYRRSATACSRATIITMRTACACSASAELMAPEARRGCSRRNESSPEATAEATGSTWHALRTQQQEPAARAN